ncbi:LysR substrate-binding domain-containing protein [Bordetella sp. N]|uniref:LysR substrate-binding domain-containing protein n=1 Tax=Bordetella sp. N TaxID=1746199 RepID=UPI000709D585|nr:LysR substrate-binding domain-containing protein [Bordetella sp. N]ALM84775.1 LysR family transcriptional regulator [Bordetella sp. N]
MTPLQTPLNEDLRVFLAVARKASFVAAANALGMSPAYVTKRVTTLERTLGVTLLHRTTRRVTVTDQGERVMARAQRILDDLNELVEELGVTRQAPRGTLHLCCSFGFGRQVVAPVIADLARHHPDLQLRLDLFDRLVDITAEGYDLDVRVGDVIPQHLIARPLAANRRILCASPAYLQRAGTPRSLADLAGHDCLVIKERDHPFGVWSLRSARHGEQSAKVSGPLSSNNGEVVARWAVEGHGIFLRSMWNVAPLLASGTLVQVLPEWSQEANIWAVYPPRLDGSAKVRICVEWLQQAMRGLGQAGAPAASG